MNAEISFHVKEDIITLCSIVAFNCQLEDEAQKLAREVTENNHNESQYRGCSNDYTTKTVYLDYGTSSHFLLNRYVKTFWQIYF